MIEEKENKYYRICDDCKAKKEIQKQQYLKLQKQQKHLCLSCCQKGSKNHAYGKKPWNKGLTKENDTRVMQYSTKSSSSRKGKIPWNKGNKYVNLKGEAWAKNFSLKLSQIQVGKANLKNRKNNLQNKSARYFRKLFRMFLYAHWTKKILIRDNFSCQNCGKQKNLEVHHIIPFRVLLQQAAEYLHLNLDNHVSFTENEVEMLREELLNRHKLEYGVTLCKECHENIDKYRRQFHEKNNK